MAAKDLVERAQQIVGDRDTIVAAAWLEPRGRSGGLLTGLDAGDVAGRSGTRLVIGAIGGFIGEAVGRRSGGFTTNRSDGLTIRPVPANAMIAVSATRLYVWAVTVVDRRRMPGEVVVDLPRDAVVVNVHGRVSVRVVEVCHPAGAEKWEFEADRLGSHITGVIAALRS